MVLDICLGYKEIIESILWRVTFFPFIVQLKKREFWESDSLALKKSFFDHERFALL